MANKVTLANVANLQDTTTAAITINNNSTAIVAGLNNTLSLDGTQPNQMAATLDMNSNHIINLPAPASQYEPLRLVDANTLNGGGTINAEGIPSGGTTGQALEKTSNADFAVAWTTPALPSGLNPTGGTTGQILTKTSSTNYAYAWEAPATYYTPSGTFNVVTQYNADPTGTTNSASNINAAIAAASAVGGIVFFPAGTYLVNGGLNLTNSNGLTLQGSGRNSTILKTTSATNAILDMTGTNDCVVEDLQLYASSGSNTLFAILLATSTTFPNNVNVFRNVTIESWCTQAPIYIYGSSDSSMYSVTVGHYNPSCYCVMAITDTNILGVTSTYTTITTGSVPSGDWAFYSCEFHDISTYSPATYSTVTPIIIYGNGSPIKWFGGLIAGSVTGNNGYVQFGGTSGNYPQCVSFNGVQFYADNGLSSAFVFYSTVPVTGLVVHGCYAIYSGSVFSAISGSSWTSITVTGNYWSGPNTMFTVPAGNAGTITSSMIDCQAHTVNVGTSGTISHTLLQNVAGSITGVQTSNSVF